MKLIFTFLTLSSLIACNKIDGKFKVYEPLQYVKNDQNEYLKEGDYKGKIKLKKDALYIKLTNNDHVKKGHFKISLPKNFDFPSFSLKNIHAKAESECVKKNSCSDEFVFKLEAFFIEEEQTNQPFNTNGFVLVERLKPLTFNEVEKCIIPDIDNNMVCSSFFSNCPNGYPGIRNITYIEYRYNLFFGVHFKQDKVLKAKFDAEDHKTYRTYLDYGRCQLEI